MEQKYTKSSEPYLLVHGFDLERIATGSLRFWRHEQKEDSKCFGQLWFIRGMKVEYSKFSSPDWTKVAESCWCTAIEVVTDIAAIQKAFRR